MYLLCEGEPRVDLSRLEQRPERDDEVAEVVYPDKVLVLQESEGNEAIYIQAVSSVLHAWPFCGECGLAR